MLTIRSYDWIHQKNVIISKELACFIKGYFMTVLKGKKACPFRLNSLSEN